jgi:hypothetical protein
MKKMTELCNGNCSASCNNENEIANHTCTCNHKGLSPVIDADENDIISLTTMKGECIERMDFIRNKYMALMAQELSSWEVEYKRLDGLLSVHYRPGCFGSMTCTDSVYELCPSNTVKACQSQHRGMA